VAPAGRGNAQLANGIGCEQFGEYAKAGFTQPSMKLCITDPLTDPRWKDLVAQHPLASPFHQRGWLQALSRTYGYKPFVLTSAANGEPMRDGVVLCHVSSWITGTRVVSLPFSDHCEPLLSDPRDLPKFAAWLRAECEARKWKYVEIRPFSPIREGNGGLHPSASYCFHEVDLRLGLDQLFRSLHKDSVQRRIKRAEREKLSYTKGRSEILADEFYQLMVRTRKRHQSLPQPRAWFRNLMECMSDDAEIRVAATNGTPIAAMLTLTHGRSVTYKYGCSDERLHKLGAMPFLFWRLIEESKALGVERIDFGRSALDQESLIRFKDKLGTTKKMLEYYRYPQESKSALATCSEHIGRQIFAILPSSISSTAGRLVYRHMG
jgi:CelD/BcsL family acetyltransferase involved in cellulose biosynthesis